MDLFSSVWLGIGLLTLLFIYCSVGSAVPSVRQMPWLELSEFEWFHWWPFNLLVALFCLNLSIVTIRRIPLRWVNAGVWTIHMGIITLVLGSYYYFSTKLEGDAPVFRRQVKIEVPGGNATLVALPGSETEIVADGVPWRFKVESTNSEWPILSEEHKGKKAYAVNVLVTPPTGVPFIRQLLDGYPQYTEDILPGKGRAIKVAGRKLMDESFRLALDFEPQDRFYLMQTWALYQRRVGEPEWVERPLQDLPKYNDRISSRSDVFTPPGEPLMIRPIDLVVPRIDDDVLEGAPLRVTSYLRYADLQRRWRDGGDRLYPVLMASASSEAAPPKSYELHALDPVRNRAENDAVQFLWLDDPSRLANLPSDSRALLRVSLSAGGPETPGLTVPITHETIIGRQGPFTPIGESSFAYRILHVEDNLAMPDGRVLSVAMVEIKTPEGQFTRMVADQAEATRDLHGEAGDPHGSSQGAAKTVDPRIQITYQPGSAPVMFVAHPNGLHLVVNGPSGRLLSRDVTVGEMVEVLPGLRLRAEALYLRAIPEIKPFVVPIAKRNRSVGENAAMIRVELETKTGAQARWLQFNPYPFRSQQYSYPGRFVYSPERFVLPNGAQVELMFSRASYPLPAAIAMEDFELDTHVGGYTGSVSTIRNYFSRLRFWNNGRWSEPSSVSVNHPTEFGGFWYFQSTWDRPPPENPNGGMNHTGLGVGNRRGVYVQLLGCCLAVAGMLFAFYVKPIIKRRQREKAVAKLGPAYSVDQEQAAMATEQPVLV